MAVNCWWPPQRIPVVLGLTGAVMFGVFYTNVNVHYVDLGGMDRRLHNFNICFIEDNYS